MRFTTQTNVFDVQIAGDETAILRDLRLTVEDKVARYWATALRSSARALMYWVPLLTIVSALCADGLAVVVGGVLLSVVSCIIGVLRSALRIDVGSDGVRLAPILGRSRFVSFGDIEAAHADAKYVYIISRSKPPFSYRVHDQHYGAQLVTRITIGLKKYRQARRCCIDVAKIGDTLARGSRSVKAWVRDSQQLTNNPERLRYRVATIPGAILWRVIEDVHASDSSRIGAAMALQAHLDTEARSRLAQVAESSASAEIHEAFLAVARGDDFEDLANTVR